jgi:hypothetical protein
MSGDTPMRAILIAAATLLAAPAWAAPAEVSVTIAPALQKTFKTQYGDREAVRLADSLKTSVERALVKSATHDGARIELELVDVKPNRPTFKQLGDKPGLSMQSFGVGGAALKGRMVAADGRETPLSYRWFETDIENTHANWVWSDAEWAFDRFARRLAKGEAVASR